MPLTLTGSFTYSRDFIACAIVQSCRVRAENKF